MDNNDISVLKNRFNEALRSLERSAKIELCTERGINMAREYARDNFNSCNSGYINMAHICYASTCLSFYLFCNWWQDTFKDVELPYIDKNIFNTCAGICARCSPKSATGVGLGAGAIGGFLVGGLVGAAIGAVVGGVGGKKLTEEASGERYYSILRESISTLYNHLIVEVNRMVDYSTR